jgi:hypothetical protein
MTMSTVKKSAPATVLMNAFNNASEALSLSRNDKIAILGINAATLSRKIDIGFSPQSKTGQLQLNFIGLYRSLYAIAGGDNEFMQHWYQTNNKDLNGVPNDLCKTRNGLIIVNQYLDVMRRNMNLREVKRFCHENT